MTKNIAIKRFVANEMKGNEQRKDTVWYSTQNILT